MRIIAWNCNMAFRKKASAILALKPDILVIPECEHPDKLKFATSTLLPKATFWFGDNTHKGIGIFSYSDYRFKLHKSHNPVFKHILPITVTDGKIKFTLFAIWANNPSDKEGQYVTQIWKAVHFYDKLIRETKTILVGDFNSNTIWDKPKRVGNHSALVKKLEERKIYSTYHHFYNQKQGLEKHPTFFLYRHLNKPYHLDYCFASIDFIQNLKKVEVGKHKDWCSYSDHIPLLASFNFKNNKS